MPGDRKVSSGVLDLRKVYIYRIKVLADIKKIF